ncbi:hypothetical protein [Pseudomonas sp. SDO5271_S396]
MGLLIILPLLVSGYLVCIKHPYYYCRLHRFEGQLLYLQVARLGVACLLAATFLSALILAMSKQGPYVFWTDYSSYLGSRLVQLDIANEKNSTLWVFLLQVGLTSMLMPFFWAKVYVLSHKINLNLESTRQLDLQLTLGILEGTPFKTLLKESMQQQAPCMFSFSDRKVYVGIVSVVGVPTESDGVDHAFTLIPLLSGYRDKDTLEVTLNTHYANVVAPVSIMLLQDNVVSATRFDFSTWHSFQSRKNRKARQGQLYQHRPARPMKASRACA